MRDITSQKKIESELKNNEKRFTDIIYNVSDFVWEMNENGEFTFMTENIKISAVLPVKNEENRIVFGKKRAFFKAKKRGERKKTAQRYQGTA